MQVIWVSGPTAKVVTWSITARTVLLALAAASSCLVILGFVFNLIGLRVAVEYVPELAQRMGSVSQGIARPQADWKANPPPDQERAEQATVMTEIKELIEKLRALEAKASPGPWYTADWSHDDGPLQVTVEFREPEILLPEQSGIWPDGIRKRKREALLDIGGKDVVQRLALVVKSLLEPFVFDDAT